MVAKYKVKVKTPVKTSAPLLVKDAIYNGFQTRQAF
jgi:hypothetical protein